MTAAARTYGPATTQIFRIMTLAFGPAAVVFGALAAPAVIERFTLTTPWWSVPTLAATLAVPVAASIVSWSASVRTLRFLMGVTAVGYALAMLTLSPALHGQSIPNLASPWILSLAAIGTTAAAIAWRARFVWPYLMLIAVMTALDRVLAADAAMAATAGEDALDTLMYCAIFAGLALISIRAGRILDAAAADARVEAARAAAARARGQETARIDGLVHDSVLATLVVAARRPDGQDAGGSVAAIGARRALAQLEELRQASTALRPDQPPMRARELVWLVQSITTDLDPQAQFSYDPIPDLAVTRQVAQALGEATGEALRNSVQHADGTDAGARAAHPVTRAVHVCAGSELIEVTILDDGVGFDPGDIDEARLGIEVSIRGRMSAIAGGRATVVSRRGFGTRVVLQWRRG